MGDATPTRKDQLFRAAERLFSQRGYHAATMRELAGALQIEGGSLYSHIAGKQDILFEIVRRASEQFLAAARAVAQEGGPAAARLRAFMRRHMAIIAESTDRAAVYFHEWRHLDPERQAVIRRARDEYEAALRRIIADGMAAGEFRPGDARLAAWHVLSLLNWTYQWYDPAGPLAADDLADAFFEQVMRGMRAAS
jgi:AcrR family transcriptional regulator